MVSYFSAFTGAGGFEQGMPKEWKCVGFSEIDKYANMVLKYHYPNVKNYGDINEIRWNEIPKFDLLVGGSPCQDLSLAGKRKGLAGERSGLFFQYIRALKEAKPSYFVFENVAGALSSNGGWDFGRVLLEFSENGYNLWWQILNAKNFNVPQNRKRIFIVGFRNRCPPEVFFEREDSKKADGIQGLALTTRYYGGESNENYVLAGKRSPQEGELIELTKDQSQGYRVYDPEGISTTLASEAGGLGAKTGLYLIPSATKKGYEIANEGDSIRLAHIDSKTGRGRVGRKQSQSLMTEGDMFTIQQSRIRRLTPTECELLMGWEKSWTKYGIDEKGNRVEISDSQRYKMCGNGVVSNVVRELVKGFQFEEL